MNRLFERLSMRILACALIALTANGCSSWKRANAPLTTELSKPSPPKSMRLVLANGTKHVVREPRVVADSLVGTEVFAKGGSVFRDPKLSEGPFTVAIDSVQGAEFLRADAGKTVLLIFGVAAIVAAIGAAIAVGSMGDMFGSSGGTSSGDPYGYSCPLIDSWDGAAWRLDSGTFGGAIFRSIARTDVDPLTALRPVHGRLELRVRNAAPETDHVDALALFAVDHPLGTEVAPDGAGLLHAVGLASAQPPLAAVDGRGRDVRAAVAVADGRFWESTMTDRDPAHDADARDELVIDFARPAGARAARLLLDARNTSWAGLLMASFVRMHGDQTERWYDAMNADTAAARALEARVAAEAFLEVAVWDGESWRSQGRLRESGPEVEKRQVHMLDLSAVPGPTVRVRLRSAPSIWLVDQVALDGGAEPRIEARALTLLAARDMRGEDALARLGVPDGTDLVLEPGDSARVTFAALPAPGAGLTRTYVAHTSGWYRVHAPNTGPVDTATLQRLATDPLAIGRVSIERVRGMLVALREAPR